MNTVKQLLFFGLAAGLFVADAHAQTTEPCVEPSAGSLLCVPAPRCGGPQPTEALFRSLLQGLCVKDPEERTCQRVEDALPEGKVIRERLVEVTAGAPDALRDKIPALLGWSDAELVKALRSALAAARCLSHRKPGPAKPQEIGENEVKAWLLSVVDAGAVELKILRPIVTAIPPGALKWAWLRSVEIKRGLATFSLEPVDTLKRGIEP
jgi:hypothetical protein